MKPKKIAVMYDCGTDFARGLETRISIAYETHENTMHKSISAFTLKPDGETASVVHFELTDEVLKEILEILNNKKQ